MSIRFAAITLRHEGYREGNLRWSEPALEIWSHLGRHEAHNEHEALRVDQNPKPGQVFVSHLYKQLYTDNILGHCIKGLFSVKRCVSRETSL